MTAAPPESDAPEPRPVVPPALVAFAQSGCGVAIASSGADGAPILGLGVGCRISAAGVFRILLGETANPALLSALADGRPVAVTFTATRNHDSFQVKAARAELRPASPDDLPEMDRQNALFRDGLVEIGYSPVQAVGYCVWQSDDLVAIELVPERVFTQSPGPGAGTEIAR